MPLDPASQSSAPLPEFRAKLIDWALHGDNPLMAGFAHYRAGTISPKDAPLAEPIPALTSQVECIAAEPPSNTERLRQLVETSTNFVWRYLRRMGHCAADCDEIVQEACLVVARRMEEIRVGCERAYWLQVAVNIASTRRRSFSRELLRIDQSVYSTPQEPAPNPEQAIEVRQARQELDAILTALTPDLRTVFVLYELEELTTPEIAEMLALKEGTVASRLRRARADFQRLVRERSRPPIPIAERTSRESRREP